VRYPSPDGKHHAAVWPDGEKLAILRSDGQMVIEKPVGEFGPPDAHCRLVPMRWLPDSSGVLFISRCMNAQHAVLLLPVPGR
jgi:hypothetical protein